MKALFASLTSPRTGPPGAVERVARSCGWLALVVVLVWAYASSILGLVGRWWNEPDYLHGFLVAPFAAWLLWHRRAMLQGVLWQGSVWGLALIAVGAGMRCIAAYFYYELLDPLSLVPCLAGLVLFLGGWPALSWAWPAIVFLGFMVPLPGFIADRFSHPLQRLNTEISLYVIQTLGIPGTARGNVLVLAHGQLGVAEACSGLRMMPLFAAVSVAAAFVVRRSPLEKALVLLGIVPIAVLANVLRIVLTVVLQELISVELGSTFLHDLAGWFMMPAAVILLVLELGLLRRLFPPPGDAALFAD